MDVSFWGPAYFQVRTVIITSQGRNGSRHVISHEPFFFSARKTPQHGGFPALLGVGESSTAHRRHVACVALRQVPGILEARALVKPIQGWHFNWKMLWQHTVELTYQFWCLSVSYFFFFKKSEDFKPWGVQLPRLWELGAAVNTLAFQYWFEPSQRHSRSEPHPSQPCSCDLQPCNLQQHGHRPDSCHTAARARAVGKGGRWTVTRVPSRNTSGTELMVKGPPRGGNFKDESVGCMEIMPPHLGHPWAVR